ncbi:hypothetical protein SELMODRAFT_448006 [Selaginella moellendorffii]|uniref:Uncharacterized protein n=1 Tax=Selaginella moellendorffii TaxID=88036 RepID=D8T440_SELML|nr:hypothetical protein SELMODRAFT_448006 [Selaginella moellendorffii]
MQAGKTNKENHRSRLSKQRIFAKHSEPVLLGYSSNVLQGSFSIIEKGMRTKIFFPHEEFARPTESRNQRFAKLCPRLRKRAWLSDTSGLSGGPKV